MNISVTIALIIMLYYFMEGIMCEDFDIGSSFYFMKCRILVLKNTKIFPFFGIKHKLGPTS